VSPALAYVVRLLPASCAAANSGGGDGAFQALLWCGGSARAAREPVLPHQPVLPRGVDKVREVRAAEQERP